MHRKNTKKLNFKATKIEKDFTSEKLTSYSGLTTVNDQGTSKNTTRHAELVSASPDYQGIAGQARRSALPLGAAKNDESV